MSDAPQTATGTEIFAKPEAMLRVPMGFASPLWGLFAGVAISSSAWWWMTRFARPVNLEAMFAKAEAQTDATVAPLLAATETLGAEPVETVQAVEETVETVVEPAAEVMVDALAAAPVQTLEATQEGVETVVEPAVEAVAAPIEQAVAETPTLAEAVGGESAPISPLVAALPDAPASAEPTTLEAAKPRRKAAPPKAD